MRQVYDERAALELATIVGADSPCVKSKRGVVLFSRAYGLFGAGNNHPPDKFVCDGSDACRANCNRVCVHAEMDALAEFTLGLTNSLLKRSNKKGDMHPEMLHVKVVDGKSVPSGEPSCWQCSRHVINFGVKAFWLLHENGLQCYGADEFHEHTLRICKLPVIRSRGFR